MMIALYLMPRYTTLSFQAPHLLDNARRLDQMMFMTLAMSITGSANVMNEHYSESMHNAVEKLARLVKEDPDSITPDLVRALVAAGADILDVRARATSLEQIYFEIMGARPEQDEAA